MRKALRLIGESVSLVDLVLYVLDARIPRSSQNSELEHAIRARKLFYLLNKSDMAQNQATQQWLDVFKRENHTAFAVSSKTGTGYGALKESIELQRKKICRARKEKGRIDEQIRLMVIGIPNVGKSTVINRLAGRNLARAGKKPGVTRGLQWLSASGRSEILDMPGVFYPRIEDEESAWHLAAVGTVKEEILPLEEMAAKILDFLNARNRSIAEGECRDLEAAARGLHFVDRQGGADTRRASLHILKTFRDGGYGAFTLEWPEEGIEGSRGRGGMGSRGQAVEGKGEEVNT